MTKSRILKNSLIAMVLIMFPAIVSSHIAFASQWVKTYEGLTIQSIQQTSDGGYVVAGLTTTDNSNASVLKLNADGTILWQKSYSSNG